MARRGAVGAGGHSGKGAGSGAGRGRRLSEEEASLWAKLVQTLTPLPSRRRRVASGLTSGLPGGAAGSAMPEGLAAGVHPVVTPIKAPKGRVPAPLPPAPPPPAAPRPLDRHGLDANWDRRLAKGTVPPDFTLDLHGSSLDAAYLRLEHGLSLAMTQGARVVLVITGRARPYGDPADRGNMRGAIRAKLLDWLAHGRHAGRIAAVRAAHPRHGGAGAVYVVLKRV